jgi:preprotein translocase subunit SecF
VATSTKSAGLLARLYAGDTEIGFIDRRRVWYAISMLFMVATFAAIGLKGFNLGVEFAGGNQFQARVADGVSLSEVEDAVAKTGVEVSSAQTAGGGADQKYIVRTPDISDAESQDVQDSLSELLNGEEISVNEVSSSWGTSVSRQALIALGVFLVLVVAYLWWRYERKMAAAALIALIHDLLLTAGIYALVGFEVTPSTVVGMLTILGYSLYDTVVVFDRVFENTRGTLNQQRETYSEGANHAVNQTLMRSINTTLIGLLPVAGLLFVGAWMLGVGTLKDLALVLFVGMLTGAYSSLFLATPLVVEFSLRDPALKAHSRRVLARRSSAMPTVVDEPEADADEVAEIDDADFDDDISDDADSDAARPKVTSGAAAPRPGARTAKNNNKRR